ncbi:MAG: DnaB-like helicase N-terminal domain-containing protein [Xenococcaceae cyanobacterium MO_188.B29]|nr:DnaB-like helicase N-terminal domain-containing protein [Xenococcaceae cyanobacterium MO_188.B29]
MINNDTFLGNIEAEETILGGILLDPMAMSIVADMLPVEAFCLQSHQQIYKTALELYQKDKPTDLMQVSTWLADHNLLD